MNQSPSRIVIGEGWSALATMASLLKKEGTLTWVTGNRARIFAPLPTVEAGFSAESLKTILAELGIEALEPLTGSFLRQYKNKSFREPAWTKAPTAANRADVLRELLWQGEKTLVPLFEEHLGFTLGELEETMKERILALGAERRLEVIENVSLAEIKSAEDGVTAVILANGRELSCSELYYADRWNELAGVPGVPKTTIFTRGREPMGLVQATFTHATPMGVGLREGFFTALNREAGDEFDRHMMGYFTSDGMQSIWTTCVSEAEGEDNHAIGKKLRKMKAALDKMFGGNEWRGEVRIDAPESLESETPVATDDRPFLMSENVRSEQVRFDGTALFSEGAPLSAPLTLKGLAGVWFLTDGYGPSFAFAQVGSLFSLAEAVKSSESSDVHRAPILALEL